jgi:hypothetical protein
VAHHCSSAYCLLSACLNAFVTYAVGATLGMALVLRGGSAVIWSQHQDAFPYIKGMLVIFLSWVVSPIASGDLTPDSCCLCVRCPSVPLGYVLQLP